jgi:hypothetical protein
VSGPRFEPGIILIRHKSANLAANLFKYVSERELLTNFGPIVSHFSTENGDSMFLRKFRIYLPIYTEPKARSSSSLL